MMPHLAGVLGGARPKALVAEAPWPQVEAALLVEDTITLPVQINGEKRADVTVARDAGNADVEAAVLALDAVKRALDGKAPKKGHSGSAEDRECGRVTCRVAGRAWLLGALDAACFQPLYASAANGGRSALRWRGRTSSRSPPRGNAGVAHRRRAARTRFRAYRRRRPISPTHRLMSA